MALELFRDMIMLGNHPAISLSGSDFNVVKQHIWNSNVHIGSPDRFYHHSKPIPGLKQD